MRISTFEAFGNVAPKTVATPDDLDSFVLPGGRALPPSYRDYAQHLGYGLTCGLFLIYIPMGDHCDSLKVRSKVLGEVNRDAVRQGYMDYEPDGNSDLVLRLVPFAASENGHILGWDLEDVRDGEYGVYAISPRACGVRKAARSLYRFIEQCLDARIKAMLGPGYEPLEAAFKPLVPL